MVECQLPKLDVAGSTPVSRSIFSTSYEDFPHSPNPPFSCKCLILSYLLGILPTQHGFGLDWTLRCNNNVVAGALQAIDSRRLKLRRPAWPVGILTGRQLLIETSRISESQWGYPNETSSFNLIDGSRGRGGIGKRALPEVGAVDGA